MKKRLGALLLGLLAVLPKGNAQESEKPVVANFLVEGGIEFGGDVVLTVTFTNGEDQTMRAGQGGYLAVGGNFEFPNVKHLMVRSTVGFKYVTTAADDANIRLTRLPITLVPYLKIKEDFRVGVGVSTHQLIRFNGDGFVEDVQFSGSLGPRVEVGYKGIALTYTSLRYKTSTESLSASSVGLSATYLIRKK